VNNFFRWWRDSFLVHHSYHEHAEDSIYFPALRSKGLPLPASLDAEHKSLEAALNTITDMEKTFRDARGQTLFLFLFPLSSFSLTSATASFD
jgi:hypothetical protein